MSLAHLLAPVRDAFGWLNPFPSPLTRARQLLADVERLEPELTQLGAETLKQRSLGLGYRLRSGTPVQEIAAEAFALVRVAAERTLGMRHYDVQLLAGAVLLEPTVAEMQTGEGKTLTATLPAFVRGLAGRGVHLATFNDYLARRDAEFARPLFAALGLSVGVVEAGMPRAERKSAYACAITYTTAKELGFDFLRDRLIEQRRKDGRPGLLADLLGQDRHDAARREPILRPPHFALLDEADSLLLDEARTPLILSDRPRFDDGHAEALYRWAAALAPEFSLQAEYQYDEEKRRVQLTPTGRRRVRRAASSAPPRATSVELFEFVERAIKANRELLRDRDYIVREGEVVIVDEFTGRLAEGRQWRDGLHQAVAAREELPLTLPARQTARVTLQELFRRYPLRAGMSGTAADSASEFADLYGLDVAAIPTHRPPIREVWTPRLFGAAAAKWDAIAEETQRLQSAGRPVLIGVRSIDKARAISERLTSRGVPHQTLHARDAAQEAERVAAAGERGRVTVATNMAGRGTDIRLGPGVAELGGLHVILSEMHESARIDRQLIGRCGRQGDPGSCQQYLALDDDLLRTAAALGGASPSPTTESGPLDRPDLLRLFRQAQATVEQSHFEQRRQLTEFAQKRAERLRHLGQDPYAEG